MSKKQKYTFTATNTIIKKPLLLGLMAGLRKTLSSGICVLERFLLCSNLVVLISFKPKSTNLTPDPPSFGFFDLETLSKSRFKLAIQNRPEIVPFI
jgi:hypothetical protein